MIITIKFANHFKSKENINHKSLQLKIIINIKWYYYYEEKDLNNQLMRLNLIVVTIDWENWLNQLLLFGWLPVALKLKVLQLSWSLGDNLIPFKLFQLLLVNQTIFSIVVQII